MSWADSRLEDNVQMYESHTKMPDGTARIRIRRSVGDAGIING